MNRPDSPIHGIRSIWRRAAETGATLPSVEALAEELGLSRIAIREALIQMEADGLVRRHHGSGTFANPAALEMPVRLDEQMDYVDRLEAVGFEASVEVIDAFVASIGELDGETRLDVEAPTRALRTTKRWRADGVVAVVATDTVPLARGCDEDAVLAAVDDPVIELAATFGACRADWMCTWPSAVELSTETAALLEYEVGRASLRTEQLGIGRLGTTAFYAVEHHRPDLVDYGMIRTIYS